VLVVEDGPTLTHGDMAYGAASSLQELTAQENLSIRDPTLWEQSRRPFTATLTSDLFSLPWLRKAQITDLEQTIDRVPCRTSSFATPIHLTRIVKINKPTLRSAMNTKITAALSGRVLLRRLRATGRLQL